MVSVGGSCCERQGARRRTASARRSDTPKDRSTSSGSRRRFDHRPLDDLEAGALRVLVRRTRASRRLAARRFPSADTSAADSERFASRNVVHPAVQDAAGFPPLGADDHVPGCVPRRRVRGRAVRRARSRRGRYSTVPRCTWCTRCSRSRRWPSQAVANTVFCVPVVLLVCTVGDAKNAAPCRRGKDEDVVETWPAAGVVCGVHLIRVGLSREAASADRVEPDRAHAETNRWRRPPATEYRRSR